MVLRAYLYKCVLGHIFMYMDMCVYSSIERVAKQVSGFDTFLWMIK